MKEMKYKDFKIKTEGFVRANNLRYGSIAKVMVTKNNKNAVFAFAAAGLEATPARLKTYELMKMAIGKVKEIIDLGQWGTCREYTFELKDKQFLEAKDPKWWVSAKPRS